MILFVDDEPAKVEEYLDALRRKGFAVVVFNVADDAWDWLQANLPETEAVILDVMMLSPTMATLEDTEDGLLLLESSEPWR